MSEPPERTEEDALRALEERLQRATETAERLLAEAEADAGAGGDEVPSRGWQRREDDGGETARPWQGWIETADAELLLGVLAAVRELVPVELQQRLVAALHEVLLALRALVEWCLQRAERRRAAPAEVQDIPIL